MPYLRRADGRIAVTIDSNVWDVFARLGLRLSVELPANRFLIFIPRQVEIELASVPASKPDLKAYIERQITDGPVSVTSTFGFARGDGGP